MSETVRHDGYVNMMNKYGTAKDSSTAYQYQHDYYTSDTLLTDQYSGNGLFARIIDAPADEAVKHGFTLTIEDEEITKYIINQLEMLDWEDAFATAEKWSRLYGGAIIVMLADDGGSLEEPLNIQRTRSVDALYVFERAVVTPNYDGLSDYGFSKPNSFSVSSIAGSFTVHSSRCLIFRNGRLPELVPDLNYRYFGFPEYHRIKQQLRETVTSHSYASKLLERSVQPVHKIKDLAALMSSQNGEEEILKRLDLVDTARGILNTIAIDADGEDYAFQTFSFTGVQEIIDVHCNILSAVTSIPQTILFGRSPAGMNATGYSDFENYYNMIEHIQKRNMKGNLRTLINLIIRQGKACGKILDTVVGDFKIEFNPLWNLSETEQAQVAAQKMSTASAKAAVAQTYVDLGVLDPTEVRETLKTDDIFAIDDSLDEELEDAAEIEDGETMAQMGGSPFDTDSPLAKAQPFSPEMQNAPTEHFQPKFDSVPAVTHTKHDGGPGSGNHNHEGRPGKIGGSAASGVEMTERVKEAYKTGGEQAVKNAVKEELKRAPIGTKMKLGNRTFTKLGENEYELDFIEYKTKGDVNMVAGNVHENLIEQDKFSIETPDAEEVAAEMIKQGELTPSETSVKTVSDTVKSKDDFSKLSNQEMVQLTKEIDADFTKNIFERCECSNGSVANELAAKYNLNTPPTLMSKDEFEHYVENNNATRIWRGVQDAVDEDEDVLYTAKEIENNFANASSKEAAYGGGNFGNGYHFATDVKTAKAFSHNNGKIFECAIKPNAKFIDRDTAQKEANKVGIEFSAWALMKGYDGISGFKTGVVNIMNRGALVMVDPSKKNNGDSLTENEKFDTINSTPIFIEQNDGGKGSGNFGHKGIKGKIGGSQKESARITQAKKQCEKLIGMRTITGVQIKEVHPHFAQRMVQRDIHFSSVCSAVTKGKPMAADTPDRKFFVYNGTMALVSLKNGTLITTIYNDKLRNK